MKLRYRENLPEVTGSLAADLGIRLPGFHVHKPNHSAAQSISRWHHCSPIVQAQNLSHRSFLSFSPPNIKFISKSCRLYLPNILKRTKSHFLSCHHHSHLPLLTCLLYLLLLLLASCLCHSQSSPFRTTVPVNYLLKTLE